MSRPRVLHVITAYNGRAFVPRAIRSARRMDQSTAEVDVLILDDKSPEPGWSEDLEKICEQEGALYYCTPRNLGIPRNCNLGLLAAVKNGYDFVTINNSDVIFPANLMNVMVPACQQPGVGSVTAWSNNVSVFTLPNDDPDRHLADQETVDHISASLQKEFGDKLIDTPAGISFCIMMSTDVIRAVGVNDPIFGRGYCEETDWSLRSLDYGYRICLTPSAFVYHMGRGSNISAGLVSGAHTTVPENEDIIDMRYPEFRTQVRTFELETELWDVRDRAIHVLIENAAAEHGYTIEMGWTGDHGDTHSAEGVEVKVLTDTDQPIVTVSYKGFTQRFDLGTMDVVETFTERFKRAPRLINGEDGAVALEAIAEGSSSVSSPYPATVWRV
jgi:GT2 family glycosyltransferase